MKEIIYTIYAVLLILFIVAFIKVFSEGQTLEVPKFNNAIVIEKSDNWALGFTFDLKFENDSTSSERVYQIFYDKYEVGDTIYCPQIK